MTGPPNRPAVRVSLGPGSGHAGISPVVIEPGRGGDAPSVDGEAAWRLVRFGPNRGVLVHPDGSRRRVLFGELRAGEPPGLLRQEVVVDGWRVEVEIESEVRARLRSRGRREANSVGLGGATDVRAIIPGVVVSVAVAPGDEVEIGQPLLVVEAMKMQNELRAPRRGRVGRVVVGPGKRIELGELLLVLD